MEIYKWKLIPSLNLCFPCLPGTRMGKSLVLSSQYKNLFIENKLSTCVTYLTVNRQGTTVMNQSERSSQQGLMKLSAGVSAVIAGKCAVISKCM